MAPQSRERSACTAAITPHTAAPTARPVPIQRPTSAQRPGRPVRQGRVISLRQYSTSSEISSRATSAAGPASRLGSTSSVPGRL